MGTIRGRQVVAGILLGAMVTAIAFLAVRAVAQEGTHGSRVPVPSAITYQGRAISNGVPLEGTCDLRFQLFANQQGGLQVGPNIDRVAELANGLFSVVLDFGFDPFANGNQLFVAASIRCPAGAGDYLALTPRQALTAVPFALFATDAGHAKTANLADSVPFSGITGIPEGFGQVAWDNVVIVAKQGGHFTSIQGAIDSITDEDAANRYLVWVAPGVYEERVSIPAFIAVQGAGRDHVTILSGGGASAEAGATVTMEMPSALSGVSVVNTGGAPSSTGIRGLGAGDTARTLISDVFIACQSTLDCTGIAVLGGVYRIAGVSVEITLPSDGLSSGTAVGLDTEVGSVILRELDVFIRRFGPTTGIGVRLTVGVDLDGAKITVFSGNSATGVSYVADNVQNMTKNLTIRTGITSSGTGSSAFGIHIAAGGQTNIHGATINVAGGLVTAGINVVGSRADLEDIQVTDNTGTTPTGVRYSGNALVAIRDSSLGVQGSPLVFGISSVPGDTTPANILVHNTYINASTAGIRANANHFVRVATSLLPSKTGAGNFTCVGAFNASYTALGTMC